MTGVVKVTNNAFGTLASSISSSATTIALDSGQGARFPTLSSPDYFYGTLIDTSNNLEIVKVTARSTDSLTVTRAQDNTSARAFSTGDRFELRPTAKLFEDIQANSRDLNGQELILDADGDTSITADTDDQIDIKIAGADDFQFTANTFTAQSGSTIAAQALTATTITTSGNSGFGGTSPSPSALTVKMATNKHIGFNPSQGELNSIPALVAFQDNGALADIGFRGVTVRFANASEETMRITSSGNVGIGTTNGDEYPLFVKGSNVSSGGGLATVSILDSGTAYNGTHPGGGITFRGKFNNSGSTTNFATVQGVKENTTDGNYSTALRFTTRANGGNLTEKMRIDSSGDVTIFDGDLIMGTSGNGINFAATSNASGMTSELLDDYEEGTWTPTFIHQANNGANNPSVTYDGQEGRYTKIGNMVYASFHLGTDSVTHNNGGQSLGLGISGLPFTSLSSSSNARGSIIIGYRYSWGSHTPGQGSVFSNNTVFNLWRLDDNGNNILTTDLGTGANSNRINGTVVYPVA